MRLMFLIFAAAVLFEAGAQSLENVENYSLWPRRPDELKQARKLIAEQKGGEAVLLLQPFVSDNGVTGREARQICGRVNVPRYLSRLHPGATVYTVRKGDNMARIAHTQKCPQDVIMLLNGIVDPSALKIGQKLVVVPMRLRAEIRPLQQEISVWDGDQLVADYPLEGADAVPFKNRKTMTTKVAMREGYVDGAVIPEKSFMYPSSERVLVLENGMAIAAGQNLSRSVVFRMDQKDLNELAMMLVSGNEVQVIYPQR